MGPFIMQNVINFDLSNNNVLGADGIHLTPGEDLILNFTFPNSYSYFDTSLVNWERVANNDGTVDLVIKTKPCYTLGYARCKIIVSD